VQQVSKRFVVGHLVAHEMAICEKQNRFVLLVLAGVLHEHIRALNVAMLDAQPVKLVAGLLDCLEERLEQCVVRIRWQEAEH